MGFERIAGIIATTKNFTDFSNPPSNYNSDLFSIIFDKIESSYQSIAMATPYLKVDPLKINKRKSIVRLE